jgi:phosphotransferase system HPr (HPr) family protein
MKRTSVSIPWREGLHLRPAASIVKLARKFQSSIQIRLGDKIADAGNILTIVMLAASFGTSLVVEAQGPDEQEAMTAIVSVFELETVEISQADTPARAENSVSELD